MLARIVRIPVVRAALFQIKEDLIVKRNLHATSDIFLGSEGVLLRVNRTTMIHLQENNDEKLI
jgi:hypothetical protein